MTTSMKPGWYWVRWKESDDWEIDKVNPNPTTGSKFWYMHGGRVEDNAPFAHVGPLNAPTSLHTKGGERVHPLPAVNDRSEGEYKEPKHVAERSFLGKSRALGAGVQRSGRGDSRKLREDAAANVDHPQHTEPAAERSDVPVHVGDERRVYGVAATVVSVGRYGRGWRVDYKWKGQVLSMTLTQWLKDAK